MIDDANNNTADGSTNNLSSTVPNTNDRSNDAKNAPGGLLGYFINRKIAGASLDNSMIQPLKKNATRRSIISRTTTQTTTKG